MKLYLLRHAEAGEARTDPERPLTEKGRADCERLGAYLHKRVGLKVQRVVHSPYRRAAETAQIVMNAAGLIETRRESVDNITPMDDPDAILPFLEKAEENMLLVGHNPHLSQLVARLLTASDTGMAVKFKKASLACFERSSFNGPDRAICHWTLRWFLTPNLY